MVVLGVGRRNWWRGGIVVWAVVVVMLLVRVSTGGRSRSRGRMCRCVLW